MPCPWGWGWPWPWVGVVCFGGWFEGWLVWVGGKTGGWVPGWFLVEAAQISAKLPWFGFPVPETGCLGITGGGWLFGGGWVWEFGATFVPNILNKFMLPELFEEVEVWEGLLFMPWGWEPCCEDGGGWVGGFCLAPVCPWLGGGWVGPWPWFDGGFDEGFFLSNSACLFND